MALPNSTDLFDLSYPFQGSPFVNVVGKVISTTDLSFPYNAGPFIAGPGFGSTTLTEYIPLVDGASGDLVGGADVPYLLDSLSTSRSITLTEYMYLTDSVSHEGNPRDTMASVLISVRSPKETKGSNVIRVKAQKSTLGSVYNNVLADNLVAITNATSVSNPTQTTVVIGGQTLYSWPATIPPSGLSGARCYVNYLCNALFSSRSLSDFFSWNISVNGGQGTWRTTSVNDFDSLGDDETIFGLRATVTQKGREKSVGSYGYINGGILGTRLLNKPIAFMYQSNPQYTTIIPSQALALPDPSLWKTYGDAARQIASKSNISVHWTITDYPLTDLSFQAGMTSIQALESLAESVGAKLRWNGDTQYTVLYPNKNIGVFQIPDCCLIKSMSKTCYLDIKTGIYNPGLYAFPQYPIQNIGSSQLPGSEVPPPQDANGSVERNVETLYTSSKKLTSDDPAFTLDLPFDFEDIYIKVITVTDGEGLFVTTNPTRWFLLQTGFAGRYINYNDVAGVLQPQITVDWTLFPQSNTDVDNGNFIFILGLTRKQINGNAANNQADQTVKETLARTWHRFKFIPVCQYNVSCVWFGAMPLPGMALKAAIGDFRIGDDNDVIIESVSFSNPGILNITAIAWSELSYYTNLLQP